MGKSNTPTKKVENLLSKYQKNDEVVINQLGDTLLSDTILSVSQKDKYKEDKQINYLITGKSPVKERIRKKHKG